MENLRPLLEILLFLLPGIALGWIFAQLKSRATKKVSRERLLQLQAQLEENKSSSSKRILEISSEREALRSEKDHLDRQLVKRTSELGFLQERLEEQKKEVSQLQEKFSKEFENLANRIFDQKSEKFTAQNQKNLQTLLNPLQEKIVNFEKKVEDTHKDSIGRNSQLQEQIRGLKELNVQMSKEAVNLTRALKGDKKMQGNWGELVLERVLEKSGLEKDREYFVQTSFTNEFGKRQIPDVVIHLPGSKRMIIDSKVSLNAYERFVNEEVEVNQPLHLKEHISYLKNHVESLSAKKYHQLYKMESPDFVLMFIPIEPAFAVALNHSTGLYNWAFERNIVIVTPTTLLATLRTIDSMWNSEKQQQNALEIAKLAGGLYDSFVGLTEELEKMGKQMGTVQNTYHKAMKKLTGRENLVLKVDKLKKMGASTHKHFSEKIRSQAESGNESVPAEEVKTIALNQENKTNGTDV